MGSLLHFQLAAREYAVAVHRVREILRMPALSELPDGSVTRRGLLDLRGTVIPVYDVRPVLGLETSRLRPDQYILILERAIEGGAHNGDAGIVADDVHGVLRLSEGSVEPVLMSELDEPVYEAVARHGEDLLTVLSVEGVVRAARKWREPAGRLSAGAVGSEASS